MQSSADSRWSRWLRAGALLLAIRALVPAATAQSEPLVLSDAELGRYVEQLGQDPWSLLAEGLKAPEWALEQLEALPAEDRVRLIRAGLWHDDQEVAGGAVAMVDPYWLDRAELARAAAVAQPFAFGLDNEVYYADIREWIGRSGVATALGDAPSLPRKDYDHIGQLHRSLRPEHLPLLSRLTLSDDEPIRVDAMRFLHTVAAHSDAARPLVGTTLLSWPGEVEQPPVDPYEQKLPVDPRSYELPDKDDGYPRVLAAVLDRLFLRGIDEYLAPFDTWASRWAFDSRPGASDVTLLLRLADAPVDAELRRGVAARGLADVLAAARSVPLPAESRDRVFEALRGIAEGPPRGSARWIASAALYANGAADARERLTGPSAPTVAERYAGWLEVEPEAALDSLVAEQIVDAADAEQVARFVDDVLEAPDWQAFRHVPDLDRRLAARLEGLAVEVGLVGELLALRPGMRTVPLAERVLAELRPDRMDRELLAMLEVHDPARLRARLAAWLVDPELSESARVGVRRAWLRVGAPSLGAAAVDHLAPAGLASLDADELLWFSRSRSEALTRRWLAELPDAPGDDPERAAARLATAFGLLGFDDGLARSLARDFAREDCRDALTEAWPGLVTALRDEGSEAALAVWLQARPADSPTLAGCGGVDHPVVRAELKSRRSERSRRSYLEASIELARLGDGAARAELLAAYRDGVYFWGDDVSASDRILDGDPEFVAVWREALRSNCCTCVVAAVALEAAYGVDATYWSEHSNLLRAAAVERFVRRFGGFLRPSRVADHPIVAPH